MELIFILLVLFSLLFQGGGQPVNITIQDPSFDENFTATFTDRCGPEEYSAPGWTFNGGGVLQLANNQCGIPLPPNGTIAALAGYGTSFSQTIPAPTRPVGAYTWTFYVSSYNYWYPGMFTSAISMDKFYEAPLCSVSGHALGDWTQVSLLCTVRDLPPGTMTISFSVNGWEALIAGPVSLTFTPVN